MESVAVALFVLLPAVALGTGRRETLALPLVVWPVWFLGLSQDWWGNGLGDGWAYAALLLVAVGVASVAIALVARWRLAERKARSAAEGT